MPPGKSPARQCCPPVPWRPQGVKTPLPNQAETQVPANCHGPARINELPLEDIPMSTHQAPGAVNEPTGPTLNETTGPTLVATPPWARVETPQGRSHAESRSRTADRAAHTPADDTTQVSAVLDPPAQGSSIMTRDNVPNPTQPSSPAHAHLPTGAAPVQPADPAPAVRQAAVGADVPAADSPRRCPGRGPGCVADVPGPSDGGVPRRPARLGQNAGELRQGAVAGIAEAGRGFPARPFRDPASMQGIGAVALFRVRVAPRPGAVATGPPLPMGTPKSSAAVHRGGVRGCRESP